MSLLKRNDFTKSLPKVTQLFFSSTEEKKGKKCHGEDEIRNRTRVIKHNRLLVIVVQSALKESKNRTDSQLLREV